MWREAVLGWATQWSFYMFGQVMHEYLTELQRKVCQEDLCRIVHLSHHNLHVVDYF